MYVLFVGTICYHYARRGCMALLAKYFILSLSCGIKVDIAFWWVFLSMYIIKVVCTATIYRKPTHIDRLLDQSSYNPTSHKATTIRTLTRRAQLVCDSPDKTRLIILTTFLVRTTTTRTLLDGTLTVTLIPTLRPTLALLRQRLYRTSEAPLKLLHVYYNLTIYVLHANR